MGLMKDRRLHGLSRRDLELIHQIDPDMVDRAVEEIEKSDDTIEALTARELHDELMKTRRMMRRQERTTRERERIEDLIDTLFIARAKMDDLANEDGIVEGADNIDLYAVVVGRAHAAASRLLDATKALGGKTDELAQIIEWDWLHSEYRKISDFIVGRDRAVRLIHRRIDRRIEEQVAELMKIEHLCVSCRKRPRHFDELCKRCANETGQRPVGKV